MEENLLGAVRLWESFYVIVGTSAAAITGLMFVVIALISETPSPASSQGVAAFGTPNVVHLCTVILISGVMTAPWHSMTMLAITLALMGSAGVVYSIIVFRRTGKQEAYKPVFEDWLWHSLMPFVAYGVLVACGIILHLHEHTALFLIGAVSLLLMFVTIHNAWDTITYMGIIRPEEERKRAEQASS